MVRTTPGYINPVWEYQDELHLVTAVPVSGMQYEILPETRNVRIYSIEMRIQWGVTQPTPIETHLNEIDGVLKSYQQANPVTNVWYDARNSAYRTDDAMLFSAVDSEVVNRAFLIEGRSVRITQEVTWAVTQPTDLETRIKWALKQ